MDDDPVYLLDSNVFMEAKNRYYAFDIVPGFWQALINSAVNTASLVRLNR